MLTGFLIALHILVCIILILVILIQTGRGAGLAGVFGSTGGETVFGGRGAAPFLIKATIVLAILFMLSSIGINLISPRSRAPRSVIQQQAIERLRERPLVPEAAEEGTLPIPVVPETSQTGKP